MASSTERGSALMPMTAMLISGACNTIIMKFMCMQVASPGPGMAAAPFIYPFFQTMLMMLGELLCLGVFFLTDSRAKTQGAVPFPAWIMVAPVSCDWIATTLVNMAYVILPASVIQMCRGCIVLFTCLFSTVFLGKRQQTFHYLGVFLVAMGITIVSLQAVLYGKTEEMGAVQYAAGVGIALCIGAQIFQATMLTVEEKFLDQYNVPPLQMVGLEGLFGCIIGLCALLTLQHLGIENTYEALYMVHSDRVLQTTVVVSMISIAVFNWSGVTVTQRASCTARATIDVSRTVLIWAVELLMLWNTFSWMQLAGFFVLTIGTLVYNQAIVVPGFGPKDEEKSLV